MANFQTLEDWIKTEQKFIESELSEIKLTNSDKQLDRKIKKYHYYRGYQRALASMISTIRTFSGKHEIDALKKFK